MNHSLCCAMVHITPHFMGISPSGSTDSLHVKQTRELKTAVASIFPKICTKTSLMCEKLTTGSPLVVRITQHYESVQTCLLKGNIILKDIGCAS